MPLALRANVEHDHVLHEHVLIVPVAAAAELVCRSCVKGSAGSRPLIADLSRGHDHSATTSEPEGWVAWCYLTG